MKKVYMDESAEVVAVHNIKTLQQKITEEMLMARDINGDTLLHSAVRQNCLKELISKFNYGVKITEKMLMAHDINGDTVLHIAGEQLPELVKGFSRDITLTPTLMAKAVSSNGTPALDWAGYIKELIAAGLKITSVADLEVKFLRGDTILYRAIEQKCLKELVGAFGYGVKITEKMLMAHDINGDTVLHIVGEQLPELVKGFSRDITLTPTLMAKAVNSDGISALDWASDIKGLIAAGLRITSVAELSVNGHNFLYDAIEQKCLKELVGAFSYGVKITEEVLLVRIGSGTVLHAVVRENQLPELVKYFPRDVTLTPTLMAKAVNKYGESLLDYAIGDIKKLIAAGLKITSVADLEIQSKLGTVLYLAIKQNCLKELVGAFGYGVKRTEEMLAEQIFHAAMKHEWVFFDNLCKSLANAGIKITDAMLMKADAKGNTIFHEVAKDAFLFDKVFTSLAQAGIKITEKMLTIPNVSGFTALDYAALNGNLKCLTDAVADFSNNEDALRVFIEKNEIDYNDTKENLIFFNPSNAKDLGEYGSQEYNLFNIELLKRHFNVFEISNISDARDIRKIDLQKNGHVNVLLNIHGNSNAKYTMSLFNNYEATSDEVLNFVAAYSHKGAKLKILSKACFGANIHHSNIKLANGSILMSLSDEDNITHVIDYRHDKMQGFLSSALQTGPIKLEDFFKIYCLSQKVYQNTPKISIYNTENKVTLSLDVFLEQNIEKINSLPKLVQDFLQNVGLQGGDLLRLLPEVASHKQLSLFKAPLISALGQHHEPLEVVLKQYYATPIDDFSDVESLRLWDYKPSIITKHTGIDEFKIHASDATSNAIAKHSLLLTLSADLFFTNFQYRAGVLELVKGYWFYETMGRSYRALETICDYLPPVLELESLDVLGVVQAQVVDVFA